MWKEKEHANLFNMVNMSRNKFLLDKITKKELFIFKGHISKATKVLPEQTCKMQTYIMTNLRNIQHPYYTWM